MLARGGSGFVLDLTAVRRRDLTANVEEELRHARCGVVPVLLGEARVAPHVGNEKRAELGRFIARDGV